MSRRLQNYLKTYRKRASLSQGEMAFLLGCQSGSKVSRYERNTRQPSLKTAFIYEAILCVPAKELFSGMYQKIQQEAVRRAYLLSQKLMLEKPSAARDRKLEVLGMISCETIKPAKKL